MAKKVRKPPPDLLKLANQALPKAAAQRNAKEKRAVRLTRAWRKQQAQRAGGGGANPLAPMTMQQINQLASQLAQSDILPEQQQLDRERQRLMDESKQQAQLYAGLTQGLGGIVGQIAPNIQNTYRQAAQDQASFAQGFSTGMQNIAAQDASRNAAFLEQLGAPAGQIQNVQGIGQGAGDVLYGTGGYLPAASLGQQGAAFASYGATLPAMVARMGQQDIDDLNAATAKEAQGLADQAAQLAAQLPGLRKQYVQTLLSNEMDKMSMAAALRELGLKEEAQAFDQQFSMAQLGAEQAADQAAVQGENRENRNKAKKDRDAYVGSMGELMSAVYSQMVSSAPAGSDSPVGAVGGQAGGGGGKPSFQKAFNTIYGELKAQLGTLGKRGWRYGVRDAVVRKMIRDFLKSKGIVPRAGGAASPAPFPFSDNPGGVGPYSGAVFGGFGG